MSNYPRTARPNFLGFGQKNLSFCVTLGWEWLPIFHQKANNLFALFSCNIFSPMILIEIFQLCPFAGILELIWKSCLKLIKNSHKTPSGGNFDGLVGSNMWEVFMCFIWILKPTITKSFSPIRSSASEPLQKAQEEFSFLHNLNNLEEDKKTN